jgi:hypothetical protein
MLKLLKRKVRNAVRSNTKALNPSETLARGAYISPIIQKKFYNYYDINHRVAVCKLDGPGRRLTYGFADTIVAKTWKYYSSHEIDAKEVMIDVRKKLNDLAVPEIVRKAVVPFIRDGYVLLNLQLIKEEMLNYDVFGEYESPPKLWVRDNENKIILYKVQYTPQIRAFGHSTRPLFEVNNSGQPSLRMVNKEFAPKEIIHVERGESNFGGGNPLIEGCWDSIMKLAGESHQEMIDRRTIPTLHLTEDERSDDHAEAQQVLKMVANSNEDTARVWYHKKLPTGEITDYPMFAYESPTSNPNYNTRNQNKGISGGEFGNLNNEWTRLTTATGHTIRYFIGNPAGHLSGAEVDKDQDIVQEIIDFGLCEKIIRKIMEWLEAKGIISIPEESFVIKYWKDWENIEAKAKAKEEMKMMGGQNPQQLPNKDMQAKSKELPDNTPEGKKNRRNAIIINEIMNCIHMNLSYAMTPVMSSWIARVGYNEFDNYVYMQLLSGKTYKKPAPTEQIYLDWVDSGSKGGFFWDYLSNRDPPWEITTIPENLQVAVDWKEIEAMSEYKKELVGTSRDLPTLADLGYSSFTDYWLALPEHLKMTYFHEFLLRLGKDYPFTLEDLGYASWEQYWREIGQYFDMNNPRNSAIEKQFVKVPILDYQLINNVDTETKVKRLGKEMGWSMGTGTATKIKNLFSSLKENAIKGQKRVNAMSAEAFGNSIKEHHPLMYDIGGGQIVEEYICPDSWKANVGRIVPLGVYHNRDDLQSPDLPDWQVVGTAEIFGWDDLEGEDFVRLDYDYDKTAAVFEKLNYYDWLTLQLKEKGTADISTAYYCDIEYRWSAKQNKLVRIQTNIDLKSISFVPAGNCPGDVCSIVELNRRNDEMQECIRKCIAEGKSREQCIEIAYKKYKGGE